MRSTTPENELLLKYREMARFIWNSGFWQQEELRNGDLFTVGEYITAFRKTMARLYEGVVLLPLGCQLAVEDIDAPGATLPIAVQANWVSVSMLVAENLPSTAGNVWKEVKIKLEEGSYDFEFIRFFDWDNFHYRDFQFVEFMIRGIEQAPEMIGHHGLLPAVECLFRIR